MVKVIVIVVILSQKDRFVNICLGEAVFVITANPKCSREGRWRRFDCHIGSVVLCNGASAASTVDTASIRKGSSHDIIGSSRLGTALVTAAVASNG